MQQINITAERRLAAVRELQARRVAKTGVVPYTKHTFPMYEANWHHLLVAEYLEQVCNGEIDRFMVYEPPRHGKSEQVTVRFNGYYLGHHPEHSIIGCSYAQDLARTFSRATRNIFQGPQYQQLWRRQLATESDTNWQIAGRADQRPSYIAAGVGGPISGQGAHLLNIDDPIKNHEEADSVVTREAHWNWWRSTARTRVMPGGRIVLTMTRWHEDDLAGRLLQLAKDDKKADQWIVLVLPATNDNGDEAYVLDTRTQKKTYLQKYTALWPEAYPREELDRIKASSSPRWWNSLYQQRPSALAGGIIQRDWIVRMMRKDHPNKWHRVVQSWDMTFKDTKTSAFVAGQVWARFLTRQWLLDQWREHAGFAKTCKAVRELTEKWPQAQTKLVEDRANGPAIMESLADEVGGFIPIEPTGSKEARLEACSPQYMSKSVIHPYPEEAPWILGVEEELFTAPNNMYWDQADCVSQYLNWDRMLSVGPISHIPSQHRQQHSYLRSY